MQRWKGRWRPRGARGPAGELVERRGVEVRPDRLFIGPAAIVVLAVVLVVLAVGAWQAKPLYHWYKERQAVDLVEQARAAIEEDDWSAGLRLGLDAYRAKPDHPEVMRLMARLASVSARERETALFFVRQLEAMGEAGIKERRTKVGVLMALGRDDEAAEAARELVARHPDDVGSRLLASEALERAGDTSGALIQLERSVDLAPDDERARLRLGIARSQSVLEPVASVGREMLWELGRGTTTESLAALVYLSDEELVARGEEEELIRRLEAHPEADERERMHALKWRILLDPERRRELVDEAVEARRGKPIDEMLPFVEMLASIGEAATIVEIFELEDLARSPSILAHYLNSLVGLRRWREVVEALSTAGHAGKARSHLALARAWVRAREQIEEAVVFAEALAEFGSPRQSVRDYLQAARAPVDERALASTSEQVLRDHLVDALRDAPGEGGAALVMEIAEVAEELGFPSLAADAFRTAGSHPRFAVVAYDRGMALARREEDRTALGDLSRDIIENRTRLPSRLVEEAVYVELLFGNRIEVLREIAAELVASQPDSSNRNLILALAEYRIFHLEGCRKALDRVRPEELAHGPRAVLTGLLLELDRAGDAFELSLTLPDALLLPEEKFMVRSLLGRARWESDGTRTLTTERISEPPPR